MIDTQEVRDAFLAAKEAAEAAKQMVREAEAEYKRLADAQRQAWIEVRNAEWQEYRSKKTGEVLNIRRVPTEGARK